MDLVDEQHVTGLKIGQDRREVARAGNHRPGGLPKTDPQLRGHDLCQRGLAQPRWAVEQHVVDRLAALLGGFDADLEVAAQALLPDEILQYLRAQALIHRRVAAVQRVHQPGVGAVGVERIIVGHASRPRFSCPTGA
ncbi:MAG: Uncharacterised protein [Rhodospirillaceae bacterium]|nr:MAG: Uncharacterised protein [Rhodospirillaceae bacterium]